MRVPKQSAQDMIAQFGSMARLVAAIQKARRPLTPVTKPPPVTWEIALICLCETRQLLGKHEDAGRVVKYLLKHPNAARL